MSALAKAYLAGGARFLQIRGKQEPDGHFLRACEDIVAQAHGVGAIVLINDRADIAEAANADGVHVGQDDLPPTAIRGILGGSTIVGLSTHSADQVRAAARLAIDYVAVGPVFGTLTKAAAGEAVGTDLVSSAAAIFREAGEPRPIVAIGGITLDRAPAVLKAGAAAVAVISDLLATGNPEQRVRQYLQVLESGQA
jgi:thiamine-phosphate pyrophosphorylase